MNNTFNVLIDSFIANNVGITDNFLSETLSGHLRDNLLALYHDQMFRLAGTGAKSELRLNTSVRSDVIYWLDPKHDNIHENSFFELMDAFILYLNETCYTGITGYEFHYTLYETGSSYQKHIDQFKGNDSRQFSMIMYLNENWVQADGGELCIYHPGRKEMIAPENGKTVFFRSSELAHEVMITNKNRMSITGWLKR